MPRIGRQICDSKVRRTRLEAVGVVIHAWETRKVKLRKYPCQYCGFWHVTSKTVEEYEARKAHFRERDNEDKGGTGGERQPDV